MSSSTNTSVFWDVKEFLITDLLRYMELLYEITGQANIVASLSEKQMPKSHGTILISNADWKWQERQSCWNTKACGTSVSIQSHRASLLSTSLCLLLFRLGCSHKQKRPLLIKFCFLTLTLGQICANALFHNASTQAKHIVAWAGLSLFKHPPPHPYIFPLKSSGLCITFSSYAQSQVIPLVLHVPRLVFRKPSQLKTPSKSANSKYPRQDQDVRPLVSFNSLRLLLRPSALGISQEQSTEILDFIVLSLASQSIASPNPLKP